MTDVLLVAHHDRRRRRRWPGWRRPGWPTRALGLDDAPTTPRRWADELLERDAAGSAGLAISLGGDGTMLRTVQILGGRRCRSSVSTSGCSATSPRSSRRL